jgi:hypothetical protein
MISRGTFLPAGAERRILIFRSRCATVTAVHSAVGKALNYVDRCSLYRAGRSARRRHGASQAPPRPGIQIDLVTVAFNNYRVISEQTRLLSTYLADGFERTVIDNSTNGSQAAQIAQDCRDKNVRYIRLPRAYASAYSPSLSHGRALNWAYANHVRQRRVAYFGFLDHDVFPIRRTSLVAQLATQPIWGHLQTRPDRWYLWPGLCIFSADWIAGRKLDFTPGRGYDTGGALYSLLGEDLDPEDLHWPAWSRKRLRGSGDVPQSDHYELIGDWLHSYNGSNWMTVEPRDEAIAHLLRQF